MSTKARETWKPLILAEWQRQHDAWAAGETTSPSTYDRAITMCHIDCWTFDVNSDEELDAITDAMFELECEGLEPEIILDRMYELADAARCPVCGRTEHTADQESTCRIDGLV